MTKIQPKCISLAGHCMNQPKTMACMTVEWHINTHRQLIILNPIGNDFAKQDQPNLKSILSRPPLPPKTKIIQNQSFQHYQILPKQKLFKISPFNTPHPPKRKITQIQFFHNNYILQKLKWWKISPFKTTTSSQSQNHPEVLLSRPSKHLLK